MLISWKGLPPYEATWETCSDFQQQIPDFHLEDKVNLEEESNFRPPIRSVYNRRNKGKNICEESRRNKGKNIREESNEIEEERGNYSSGTQG